MSMGGLASSAAGNLESGVGFVIIGRNEGERLKRCLESVQGAGCLVYVDSGSADGSAFAARGAGAHVVELDLGTPFTAARARNVGFEKLLDLYPKITYVQFIDGDCEIVGGWIQHAVGILEARPEVAAISGRIREKNPHASVYNRLADLEWDRPTGEVESCMGVAMMRVSAFRHVGGFDPMVAAGEEPELCSRLRGRDYKIIQAPETMALHDMAMLEFSQWWLRMVRGGYASWELYERTGLESSKARLDSARIWAAGWPTLVVFVAIGALFVPWWIGLPAIFATLMMGPAQAIRICLMAREYGMAWADAWAYGWLMMAGKFAGLRGQWLYMVDRENKQAVRLIEHKTPPPPEDMLEPKPTEKSSADKMVSMLAPSPEAQRWSSYSNSQWRG